MKNKFYLISEEELTALLQNKKNMSICLENDLISKEDFGLAFIKWLVEERRLEGELDSLTIEKEYDDWAKDFIEQHYYPIVFGDENEEEEIDPMKLN